MILLRAGLALHARKPHDKKPARGSYSVGFDLDERVRTGGDRADSLIIIIWYALHGYHPDDHRWLPAAADTRR
ncbi:hypothetical protein [Mycolicibacterium sp.]|uniref:hypothetical protein n=1 Tax=Mycolicibacterium sp. TaxID=2320850 RepID=UPI003D0B1B66